MKAILCFLTLSAFAMGSTPAKEIVNLSTPKEKAQTIQFTEDLVIGPEDTGGDWFGLNVFVSVGSNEHMFVTDSAGQRVQEFDAKGTFIKSHGGKGEGPGEFQRLIMYQVLSNDQAVAFENKPAPRFTFFDKSKEFVSRSVLNLPGNEFAFTRLSPDGELFAGEYGVFAESGPIPYRTAVFTIKGEIKKVISSNEITRPDFDKLLGSSDNLIKFVSDNIRANAKMGLVSFGPDGKIYTSNGTDYRVSIWDKTMEKELLAVTRQYKPILKTDTEIDSICESIWEQLPFPQAVKDQFNSGMIKKAYEQADLPVGKNPIFGIIPMVDGMFLVVHDFNQSTGIGTADIFNEKGVFIGSVTRPNQTFVGSANMVGSNKPRMIFKGKYAYTIESRDDNEVLVRYRYKLVNAK